MIPLLAPLLLLMAGASVPPRAGGTDASVRAADSGDFLVYETVAGDTLAGLAEAHFRDPADWRRARAANAAILAGMGATSPLAAGTRLRLDAAWLRRTPAAAEIVAFRGDVRVRAGGTTRAARIGMRLQEGDGIATGAVGFVTLRLPDGSEIALPTSSAIRFERLRRYSLNGALDRRIRLEAGGTQSRVVPLPDPTSRHEITTPVGVAAVRGTEFRVRYTPGMARASAGVIEGRVGVAAGRAPERLLRAGTGIVFTAAGPGPVTRLPAPPVALDMPAVQRGSVARFALRPERGLGFRAIVATDPNLRDPVAEAESADGRFVIEGLPSGRYHLAVTAVTSDGLEGLPARFTFDLPDRSASAAGVGPGRNGPSAPTAPGPDPEPEGTGSAPASEPVSGDLDEGLAEVGESIARVYAETFGASLLEEGDSSEGVEELLDEGGSSSVALWSLGPVGQMRPALAPAGSWGSSGGVGAPVSPVTPAEPGLPAPELPSPAVPDPGLPALPGALGLPIPGSPPIVPGTAAPAPIVPPPALPVPGPATGPVAAPVPEPATWAILIAGFGMIGLGLRARRARADSRRAGAS